jgi:predicted permease
MIDNLIFSANAVAPTFALIILGALLSRSNFLPENFGKAATQVVFYIGLPAVVFIKIAETEFGKIFDLTSVLVTNLGTIAIFFIAWAAATAIKTDFHRRGCLAQGAFRSNVAIFSFPVILSVLGDDALSSAIIIMAFLMPTYNTLSVVILSIHARQERNPEWGATFFKILRNPLIVAAAAGLIVSTASIPLPRWTSETCHSLAGMAFPLGLLCIGLGLRFKDLTWSRDLVAAVILKNVGAPLLMTGAAWLAGVRGELLIVIMLISGSPSAVAGYIMAAAMDNDERFSAAIVVASSAASIITVSGAIFAVKAMGLM